MESIDKLIAENNNEQAIEECINHNLYNLAFLLSKITKINKFDNQIQSNINDLPSFQKTNNDQSLEIRILLCCSWTTSENLCNTWKKMSKDNLIWDNIKIVSSEISTF